MSHSTPPPPPSGGDRSPYSPPPPPGENGPAPTAHPAPGADSHGMQQQLLGEQVYATPGAPPYGATGQPYSEQPYGAPAQPFGAPGQPYAVPGQQHYPPQPNRAANGLAVAALVVGILSILLAWIPVINIVAIIGGLVAVVLGALALNKIKKSGQGGKGLAIAGLILGALSVVAGILVNVALGAFVSEVETAVEEQQSAAGIDPPQQSTGAEESVDPADAAPAESGDVLALGQSAELDEYTVTVTGISLNANDALAAANTFNEAPTGQYVMADVSVVYNGAEEGDPWIDLSFVFQGTDARQYDESSCTAVTPTPVFDVPTLVAGGAADFQVCMDLPPEAIEGGSFFVEPIFSFDGTRATWNIR